ncbi:MAG: polyphosphate polymerase domain-containing protein [Eubacteriales bacterium]
MGTITTFKRYELKYIITTEQRTAMLELFKEHMVPDSYGAYTIFNLYFDTPDYLLIRRSIEKPVYKEKLRARSYGQIDHNENVFLELKKKYKRQVYKRRIVLEEEQMTEYFTENHNLPDNQISKEIDYFRSIYDQIAPRIFIAYDRIAFFGKDRDDLRITFDESILWRNDNLSLCSGKYGKKILNDNEVLMEIKVVGGMPLWLTHFLTEQKIYKTSFSKYGNAYKQLMSS